MAPISSWTTTVIFDPGSELVKDTVGLGDVAEGQTVSRTCLVDGEPVGEVTTIDDVAVFGVVAAGQAAPAPTTLAFEVSVPEDTTAHARSIQTHRSCRRAQV